MKRIKIIFESDEKKIGYLIDVETKNFKSCSFDQNYQETEVSQNQPILNPKFFIQQIVNVITGALKS